MLGQAVVELGVARVRGRAPLARVLEAGGVALQVARGGQHGEGGQRGRRSSARTRLRLAGRALEVLLVEQQLGQEDARLGQRRD